MEARVARSARPTRVGSLRPAIVLYDEPHPLGDDIGTIQAADVARKPDMLIIMGTSLKVHGLRKLVKDFAKAVHATGSSIASTSTAKAWAGKVIFVNKTPPSSEWADIIDYHVCGDTDSWVDKVIVDWKKMRPADWEIQQTLVSDGDVSMNGGLKIIKNIPGPKGKDKGSSVISLLLAKRVSNIFCSHKSISQESGESSSLSSRPFCRYLHPEKQDSDF